MANITLSSGVLRKGVRSARAAVGLGQRASLLVSAGVVAQSARRSA